MINKDAAEFLKSLSTYCPLQEPKTVVEFKHSETIVDNGAHMPSDANTIFQSKSILVHIAGIFEDTSPICLITERSSSAERLQLQQICRDYEEYYFNKCEYVDGPFDESWWLVIHSTLQNDYRSCSMRVRFASYTSENDGETMMIMGDTESMQLENKKI